MVSNMKLSTSSQCVKYLMLIFNLLFVITGIVLISVGSVILGVYSSYFHFLDDKFLSVPNLLIAIGAIIFIIAFFGCCGAIRENYCMILTFTSFLVLIFILELSGGIAGYVLRNKANDVIEHKMLTSMKLYVKDDTGTPKLWDDMQKQLECCGTNNYTDWHEVMGNASLPMSCCPFSYGTIESQSCNQNSTNKYTTGCLNRVEKIIVSHAVELGGVGIGIAFIQAMGILFSIYLARAVKRSYETV